MSEQAADPRREIAIKRIQERNAVKVHAFTYLVVNGLCVAIWAMTGSGFFWPIFLIVLWGMGLVMHVYNAYFGGVYTEQQIRKEMERLPEDVQGTSP